MISAFENTLKNLILQSIYMAAKNFIFTIIIMILYTLPAYFLLASPQVFMVGIFILIVCGFGLIAYLSSFMFIKAFSPYLEDVTKKYTDDDPDSWMRPIKVSGDHSGEPYSKNLPDADQTETSQTGTSQTETDQTKASQPDSDKTSSDQVSSGQKDPRKVTKKLEVSSSNK